MNQTFIIFSYLQALLNDESNFAILFLTWREVSVIPTNYTAHIDHTSGYETTFCHVSSRFPSGLGLSLQGFVNADR